MAHFKLTKELKMEALPLKIMYTAMLICFCSVGVVKYNEFDDLPFWVAISTVIVFFTSAATTFIAAMIVIWA